MRMRLLKRAHRSTELNYRIFNFVGCRLNTIRSLVANRQHGTEILIVLFLKSFFIGCAGCGMRNAQAQWLTDKWNLTIARNLRPSVILTPQAISHPTTIRLPNIDTNSFAQELVDVFVCGCRSVRSMHLRKLIIVVPRLTANQISKFIRILFSCVRNSVVNGRRCVAIVNRCCRAHCTYTHRTLY